MYWDDIGRLLHYASQRYSDPSIRWSHRKFELRCCEIYAYETVISRCMNHPYTDPNDILFDYQVYLESLIGYFKNNQKKLEEYTAMKTVVMNLIRKCSKEE